MEKLQETYNKNGMNYKLLKRNDKAAIYEQFTEDGLHVGHEVFIVKVQKEFKFPNGIVCPEKEAFPSNESFGNWAWAYGKDLTEANKRYDEITNGVLHPIREKAEEIEIPTVDTTVPKRGRGRPKKSKS